MTDPGPPPSGLRGQLQWLERFYRFVISHQDVRSPDMLIRRTSRGTSRTPTPQIGEGSSEGKPLQFKGQWAPGPYLKDDITIRGQLVELDDGTVAGTYIAKEDILEGDLPPGVGDTGETATAVGDLAGGDGLVSVAVATPGFGYLSAPAITIGGDGTGATAHSTISGGGVASIVVDTAGSGYTFVTVTVADPTGAQKWGDFALGRWPRLTLRPPGGFAQDIVLDAGRQDVGGEKPVLMLRFDRGESTDDGDDASSSGLAICDLAELISIAPAGYRVGRWRVWDVCIDGVPKKAAFWSTDAWTPS